MELSDITKPYKRLYDDKRRKRLLIVFITSWRGISIGAKHYYAEIYEDENPIVFNGMCYYFSEDPLCKRKEFGGIGKTAFSTFDAALEWVKLIIQEQFPNHKLFECNGGLMTTRQLRKYLKSSK